MTRLNAVVLPDPLGPITRPRFQFWAASQLVVAPSPGTDVCIVRACTGEQDESCSSRKTWLVSCRYRKVLRSSHFVLLMFPCGCHVCDMDRVTTFSVFICITWCIFSCFFFDSLGRKVWPFSGPTGSVTADQISTGRVRFLASVSGTTFLFFFRFLPRSRAHDSRRPGISVVCSEWSSRQETNRHRLCPQESLNYCHKVLSLVS